MNENENAPKDNTESAPDEENSPRVSENVEELSEEAQKPSVESTEHDIPSAEQSESVDVEQSKDAEVLHDKVLIAHSKTCLIV